MDLIQILDNNIMSFLQEYRVDSIWTKYLVGHKGVHCPPYRPVTTCFAFFQSSLLVPIVLGYHFWSSFINIYSIHSVLVLFYTLLLHSLFKVKFNIDYFVLGEHRERW